MMKPTDKPSLRILLYGHDTYGLGHIRRNTAVGARLVKDFENSSALLLTGSPLAHCFFLPRKFDYVKIPSVTKNVSGEYKSRHLNLSLEEITSLREEVIYQTAVNFRPDIFIVDHSPAGMTDEIRKTLFMLKSRFPGTRIVLGLRDIIDEGRKIQRIWTKRDIYSLLEDVYDLIVVYGSRSICDVVSEYGINGPARTRVRYAGYISREERIRPKEEVRRKLGLKTDRLVLVTIGGGEDGLPVIENYLKGLAHFRGRFPYDSLIVSGPFMSSEDRSRLVPLLDPDWPVEVIDFSSELLSYINAADLVVSMGGYNTVCEILSLRKPAIIVPRVFPRLEQLLRARRMARNGLLRMIHPESLTPDRLRAS
ncbi:MAG: glycosyltransferase family protein [bacterium]